jgi:tRNA U34 5-carboxymethylaminomethyl modifying enzyme MnmG/GidA
MPSVASVTQWKPKPPPENHLAASGQAAGCRCAGPAGQGIEREYNLFDLLKRPNVAYRELMTLPEAAGGVADDVVAEQVEIQVKYQGYINRQNEELARRDNLEDIRLPADIDFGLVKGCPRKYSKN